MYPNIAMAANKQMQNKIVKNILNFAGYTICGSKLGFHIRIISSGINKSKNKSTPVYNEKHI